MVGWVKKMRTERERERERERELPQAAGVLVEGRQREKGEREKERGLEKKERERERDGKTAVPGSTWPRAPPARSHCSAARWPGWADATKGCRTGASRR